MSMPGAAADAGTRRPAQSERKAPRLGMIATCRTGYGERCMDDSELRMLCHRFFDAIERHDLEDVAACYAPGCSIWANITGAAKTAQQSLQTLADGKPRHRRRTYDDRRISTFATGFVIQYSVNIVQHDGHRRSLWACLVAQCKDGQITHIDEYLDSSRFTDAARMAVRR